VLTQAERPEIADLLISVVALAPSPRQTLVAALADRLRGSLGEGEPRMLVERALELCCDDGYATTPPALVRLLTTLLPGDAVVATIVERLRVRPPAPADPFDAVVLTSKLPFLERAAIRMALRKLLDRRPVQPLVVVNGARRSGKSYIAEFIDHVLHDEEDTRHCRIAIEPGQTAAVGPIELAGDMVTLMGGDPSRAPAPNTNLDRWVQEVANWVIATANASGPDGKWWFVLDGVTGCDLRQETRLLITKRASSLTTGVNAERHRLILLDFDRALLPLKPGLIADKTTGPIPHNVVRTAVAQVIAGSGVGFDVAEITAKMVGGLPDPITDLPELGQRLADLIESIDAVTCAGPGAYSLAEAS
jgi:hypothetical protein